MTNNSSTVKIIVPAGTIFKYNNPSCTVSNYVPLQILTNIEYTLENGTRLTSGKYNYIFGSIDDDIYNKQKNNQVVIPVGTPIRIYDMNFRVDTPITIKFKSLNVLIPTGIELLHDDPRREEHIPVQTRDLMTCNIHIGDI